MKRVLALVEGQTEERFVKDVLRPHLWKHGVDIAPTLLVTKKVISGLRFKGGLTSFGKFEKDAKRLLGSAGDALVTTLLDYYRLPEDFPGMKDRPVGRPIDRVRHVEQAIRAHFGQPETFLPFLILHEFEALLFSSPSALSQFLAQPEKQSAFASIRDRYKTPEDINERPGQSPSERIQALFPAYQKTVHGPGIATRIGLERIRAECPHFAEWLARLETNAGRP